MLIFFFVKKNGNKVRIDNVHNAKVIFVYEGSDIESSVSNIEIATLKNILNEKELVLDDPSCGFDNNVSIKIDNQFFNVACDGCPIVQCDGLYINLSDTENRKIREIMKKYGAYFPCI